MDKELSDSLWESASQLDDAIVKLGDALDVKASIVLVLATMLGALSAPLMAMRTELPLWVKIAQGTAVCGLTFAVTFALVVLWPREFTMPPGVEGWEKFIRETADEEKKSPHQLETVQIKLRRSRVEVAKERIAANKLITDLKSKYNRYAFYASGLVILLDTATLIWLAVKYL